MLKAAQLILTIAFAIGCLSMWLLFGAFENVWQHGGMFSDLPRFTEACFAHRILFLFVPVVPFIYSIATLFRSDLTVKEVVFYFALLVGIFTFFFFTFAIAVILPWARIGA